MRWILKPIMHPIAKIRLAKINENRDRIEAAIKRARKNKQAVMGLYAIAKEYQRQAARWERWIYRAGGQSALSNQK